jgi:hypothetical protein
MSYFHLQLFPQVVCFFYSFQPKYAYFLPLPNILRVLELSNPQFNHCIIYLIKIKFSKEDAVYNLITRGLYALREKLISGR